MAIDKIKLNSWLNSLLGDELIAAIQYFIAFNSCIGEMQSATARDEFETHYKEEFQHYTLLVDAMMQRKLLVNMDIKSLISKAKSGYTEISSNDSKYLIKFFSDREHEAVKAYTEFHDYIKNDDPGLDDTIISIINQEADHKLDMDRLIGSTVIKSGNDSTVNFNNKIQLFADKGVEAKRSVAKGLIRNPGRILKELLLKNNISNDESEPYVFAYLVNFNDDLSTVAPGWVPPEGLFTRSAEEIVSVLKSQSSDKKQAMSRLNFYINRAGSNLSDERAHELARAKELLSEENFSVSLYDKLFK